MRRTIRILAIVFTAVIIIGSLLIIVNNGILVSPSEKSLSNSQEIPEFDVLEWQYQREKDILADYEASDYSFQNPYIIIDPYEMNPNSALVIFEDQHPGDIEVTVQGDDPHATYTYTIKSSNSHFEIPIIGLYAGRVNIVNIKNEQSEIAKLNIETEPLPVDFQDYQLEKSVPEKMEPGVTLFTACFETSYSALLDHNAHVRGYLSNQYMAHGTSMIQLQNGNMLSTGDELKQLPYVMTSLWEFNWLGKVFREYEIPNGVHHGFSEMPNGDFLVVSNNENMFTTGTREDVVIIVDRKTGLVKKEYDFRQILDEQREPFHHFEPNILNSPNKDWMHANAAIYNEDDNTLIVSSPIQSQVVAIDADTSQIRWILGPHEGYEGSSAFLEQYLLTPVLSNFEWQWGQHAPMLLPDFDQNADTIDLLLFDNGQVRSFYEADQVKPGENYSRAVHYRIDQISLTVEQIWQYGKECGAQCYATFLGETDYLPSTGNHIVDFGGQLFADGVPTDNIVDGVLGELVTNSKVIEVTEEREIVFSVSVKNNQYTNSAETYQVERLPLFSPASFEYGLGEIKGERKGNSYHCEPTDLIKPPVVYFGKIDIIFDRIVMEHGRIVADGNITYKGDSYLLGRAIFVLRSKETTYLYAANSGINGRFFMSLDTTDLKSGTYQLSIVGAVIEGNDVLNGKIHSGHLRTPYKITVQD